MKVLIVFAHPEIQSFNGALYQTAVSTLSRAGHTVITSDLYRMGFDPISDRRNFLSVKDPAFLKLQLEELHASQGAGFAPDLEAEMAKVAAADVMIWQFPLWWFGLPAILKGWVDRVFAMGRAYQPGMMYDTGVFRGKKAMLSLTTGSPEEAYRTGGLHGDVNGVLRPIHRGILEFTGFSVLRPAVHWQPVRVDPEDRARWLKDWDKRLQSLESEAPIDVGAY